MAYWLKMVGAADDPMDNRWIDAEPELLREVRSPWRPSGIKRNDMLVYYAAGQQCLFAIARSTEDGAECLEVHATGQDRWPWLLHVQVAWQFRRSSSRPTGAYSASRAPRCNRSRTSRSAVTSIASRGRRSQPRPSRRWSGASSVTAASGPGRGRSDDRGAGRRAGLMARPSIERGHAEGNRQPHPRREGGMNARNSNRCGRVAQGALRRAPSLSSDEVMGAYNGSLRRLWCGAMGLPHAFARVYRKPERDSNDTRDAPGDLVAWWIVPFVKPPRWVISRLAGVSGNPLSRCVRRRGAVGV